MFTDRSVSSAETDGSEGHSRPRSGSAGEEIQQPGAQEGDHGAAGGRGKSSVSVLQISTSLGSFHSSPNIQNFSSIFYLVHGTVQTLLAVLQNTFEVINLSLSCTPELL